MSLVWTAIFVVSALIVSAIIVYMMVAYHERFSWCERLSMGVIAGSMFLRMGPTIGKNLLGEISPYDDWSTSVLNVGLMVGAVCIWRRMERSWTTWE